MRRFGFLLLAFCLTVGTVGAIGCGGDDAATDDAAPAADDTGGDAGDDAAE